MNRADDSSHPDPTVHLSIPSGGPRLNRSDAELAAAQAAQSSPRFEVLKAQQLRLANRGAPALVVVDHALPNGELARVRLGQPGPLARYIVLSRVNLTDAFVDRAMGLAFRWESEHPDDVTPMAGTLYMDGSYTVTSDQSGNSTGHHNPIRVGRVDSEVMSSDLLQRANAVAPEFVPGVGMAHVVRLHAGHE